MRLAYRPRATTTATTPKIRNNHHRILFAAVTATATAVAVAAVAAAGVIHQQPRRTIRTLKILRDNLEAFLSTHKDKALRSIAPNLVVGAKMPGCCGWGAAVGCLRHHSSYFADLNLKVSRGKGMSPA